MLTPALHLCEQVKGYCRGSELLEPHSRCAVQGLFLLLQTLHESLLGKQCMQLPQWTPNLLRLCKIIPLIARSARGLGRPPVPSRCLCICLLQQRPTVMILSVQTEQQQDVYPYHTGQRYELRIYSLEPGSLGQILRSCPLRAAHCLTSVQFSPTSQLLLVSYGRWGLTLILVTQMACADSASFFCIVQRLSMSHCQSWWSRCLQHPSWDVFPSKLAAWPPAVLQIP